MGIIAAVQTPAIYLDAMACAQRAAARIAEAAEHGAWLAVFPETFIPGDPLYDFYIQPYTELFLALQRRFAEQAITVPGPETNCIAAACRAHHLTVANSASVASGAAASRVHIAASCSSPMCRAPPGIGLGATLTVCSCWRTYRYTVHRGYPKLASRFSLGPTTGHSSHNPLAEVA